jgi:diaminopimelate decarboxylase
MDPLPFADGFHYAGGALHCGDTPVAEIARACGTPLYLYNLDAIAARYRSYEDAFAGIDHLTCYAVKANSSLAVLRALARAGSGFDVNSRGELYRALRAGADPSRITMTGVGKTRQDIDDGLAAGILLFNAESVEECVRIDEVANSRGVIAVIVLRINPDVDAHTHPYIATGLAEHKFGLSAADAEAAIARIAALEHVQVAGFGMHLGSMLFDASPWIAGVGRLLAFIDGVGPALRHPVTYLNIGGGIGVQYGDAQGAFGPAALAASIAPLLPRGIRLLSEPGRFLVANAGILLSRAEYVKRNNQRSFLILDAGMNDLIRPALYEAYHEIRPVQLHPGRANVPYDIVGPVCESGDTFAVQRPLREVREGELVAIFSAGAYGATMSSTYNSRPFAAEAVRENGAWRLARARQTLEQMIENEQLPRV